MSEVLHWSTPGETVTVEHETVVVTSSYIPVPGPAGDPGAIEDLEDAIALKVDKGALVFMAEATADGLTDDTAAIQAAIDLAEAASAFGATVQLPSGDMLTATGITLPDYVSLKGSGRGSRLQADGGITALTVGTGCHVSDLAVRGDATAGGKGIAFTNSAHHWSITDCWISGHETGCYLTETYIGSLTRCFVLSNVTGLRITGANVNAINVTGGEIQGNSGDGVYCDTASASTGVKFIGATIEGNGGYGFHNAGAPYGWKLRDCYFEANTSGHIYSSANIRALRIDGCTFSGVGAPINLANAFDTEIVSNLFNQTVGPKSINCAATVQRTTLGRNWYRVGNEFVAATDYLGTDLILLDRSVSIPGVQTQDDSLDELSGKTIPSGATLADTTTAQTLQTKRVRPRVNAATSAATVTPDLSAEDVFLVLAQAAVITFAAPIGTPLQGERFRLRFKDNGTPRAITWNAIYRDPSGILPTTTVASVTYYVDLIYNATDLAWDAVGVTPQPVSTAQAAAIAVKQDAPTAWTTVTGGAGKFDYTTAGSIPQERLFAGFVEMAGRITVTGGAGITAGDVVFILPAGRRPPLDRRIASVRQDGSIGMLVLTAATGAVTVPGTVAGVTYLDMDMTRFRV